MNEDKGLKDFFIKIILVIIIIFFFGIPIYFYSIRGDFNYKNKAYNFLEKKETGFLLMVNSESLKGKAVEDILVNNNIKYIKFYENKSHLEIFRKLDIKKDNLKEPSLFYIKDGVLHSYITDIKTKEELLVFIDKK